MKKYTIHVSNIHTSLGAYIFSQHLLSF